MKNAKNLIEFVIPVSGEVVYAANHREAREKLCRFGYSHAQLQGIVTAAEYDSGTYLKHNGRFWA